MVLANYNIWQVEVCFFLFVSILEVCDFDPDILPSVPLQVVSIPAHFLYLLEARINRVLKLHFNSL